MLKFFILGILLLVLLFAYLYYPIMRAKQTGKIIVDNTLPFEQHPAQPTMKILVAGDSTAVGVGAEKPENSTAGRLGEQFPQADIINLGVSGDLLKDLLKILKNRPKGSYNLILLQIGANDITHFTDSKTIKAEIGEILDISLEQSPKVILLTSGNIGNSKVFHWPLSSIITTRTLNLRSIFMDEASKRKGVAYIDLFRTKENDPFENNIPKYYAPDLFHLTGDGYGVWYEDIQKAL